MVELFSRAPQKQLPLVQQPSLPSQEMLSPAGVLEITASGSDECPQSPDLIILR